MNDDRLAIRHRALDPVSGLVDSRESGACEKVA
jgi:hypothetical protein